MQTYKELIINEFFNVYVEIGYQRPVFLLN
jgi:hypothetical protein